jgi:hypothetical protein
MSFSDQAGRVRGSAARVLRGTALDMVTILAGLALLFLVTHFIVRASRRHR